MRQLRFILLGGGLACLLGLGVATSAPTLHVLFSSDILLPSDWVNNLLASPGTVRGFELPRVPSLVPDLLAVLLLTLALPWRLALVAYGALSFAGLVLLGGAVAARMAGGRPGRGVLCFGALAGLALLGDMRWNEGLGAWYLVLYPAIHSGTVLLAFAGLLLVRRFAVAPGRGMGATLAVLAAVATLSDRLFVACFVVPALAGAAARLWDGRGWRNLWRGWWPVAAVVVAGCAAGVGVDHLLFHTVLVRQPDLSLKPLAQLRRLPEMLADRYVLLGAGLAAAGVVLPAWGGRRTADGRFWWAACALGSLALLGALPLVYIDWTSYRYVQMEWWWAVVALAAFLLRVAPRLAPVLAAGACVLAAGVAAGRGDTFNLREAASWHHPAQLCLTELQEQGRVHGALAEYWIARPVAASADWTLPVAQVQPNGRPLFWGNNRGDYARAPFDALVVDHLDPAAILPRFGAPDARVECRGFTVWLYNDPARLRTRLAGTDTRLGAATVPVRFGPADIYTRNGPLPPDGRVAPGDGKEAASTGPFAALAAGPWRMVLRYSLAGTAGWEIHAGSRQPKLAAGTLEAGQGRLLSVFFDMPAGRQMELFTFPGAGAQLNLSALGLCPAAVSEPDCVRATLEP